MRDVRRAPRPRLRRRSEPDGLRYCMNSASLTLDPDETGEVTPLTFVDPRLRATSPGSRILSAGPGFDRGGGSD